MEGTSSKKMLVSLLVLMMVLLAQGRAEFSDVHPNEGTGRCAKKCTLKCAFYIFPVRIAVCFSLCMVGCKLQPSQIVYDCTSGCANSMVKAYNPTDAEKVENFVGSCYETCKNNNNN
ncbi:hypothetical protein PTKIN_Ptkin12aG0017300 [Pterospermum kingtungense]